MPLPPARRPSQPATLGDHEARIRALERQPGLVVPWVYIGDPVDNPDIAFLLGPDSPPYEDGFTDPALPLLPLRFRLVAPDDFQCVGWITGGSVGGTVTTIPAVYRPTYDQPIEGETDAGVFSGFEIIAATGALIRLS